MNIKETFIWNKLLWNRGGAYLPDAVFGGIVGGLLAQGGNNFYIGMISLVIVRWIIGKVDYYFGMVQKENELVLAKQNPYMDKKLDGRVINNEHASN